MIFEGRTIFVAPLDWGLGHATRCAPLIRQLMQRNVVLLGVTPLTKPVFDQEFPSLQQIELPPYDVSYSAKVPLWLKILFDSPRIMRTVRREHRLLQQIVAAHHIDVVISDNRFGLYHRGVHSVFITHQLYVKAPVFVWLANKINKHYINRFSEVWVPDFADQAQSLSGDLSHRHPPLHPRISYIGPQSRLRDIGVEFPPQTYDYLLLLSGPEPQRTLLENMLAEKCAASGKRFALVRGGNRATFKNRAGMDVFDFPDATTLKRLVLSSHTVICRSGYSTLMDMHALGKNTLLLIPTPGQTEQEYLAEYWYQHFGTAVCLQSHVKHLSL